MPANSRLPPQLIVDCLGQIYYFFPRIRASRKKGSRLSEPSDAILWFLHLKEANTELSAVSKRDLMDFVFRWYGAQSTLQRHYETLARAGLIERNDNEEDERKKIVWMTEEGRQALKDLRQRRYSELAVLWDGLGTLSSRDANRLIAFLQKAADTAAQLMSSDVVEDPSAKRLRSPSPEKSTKRRRKVG